MPPPIRRFNALLVEGIPGIGKSTLIDALARRHVQLVAPGKVRTFLHLSQAHTMGPLARAENAGTLTIEQNCHHLDRIVDMLEWLNQSVEDQRQPSAFVLIDTLHLTQCLRPGVLTRSDAAAFDRRLAALGCKLLLLRGSADTIQQRCIQARADWWLNSEYVQRFGHTHEEVQTHFVGEQDRFGEMAAQSSLQTLVLENDGRLQAIIDRAHELWYSVDSLRSFQRPLGQMSPEELDRLQAQFADPT